jgi:hypothetical protein
MYRIGLLRANATELDTTRETTRCVRTEQRQSRTRRVKQYLDAAKKTNKLQSNRDTIIGTTDRDLKSGI